MAKPTKDPARLRVLKRLTAILSEISPDNPDNDYYNDLRPTEEVPARVFRGRVFFGEQDPLPMISILEVPMPPEAMPSPSDATERKNDYELVLQGFVEDDPDNPTDPAQFLLADVEARLAVEKEKNRDFQLFDMGNLVTNLAIGVGVVRPPDELSIKAYFWLPLRLTLAADLKKPYDDTADN